MTWLKNTCSSGEKVTIYDITNSFKNGKQIKDLFPKEYANLTIDNFMITNLNTSTSSAAVTGGNDSDGQKEGMIYVYGKSSGSYSLKISYNAQNGILSITSSITTSATSWWFESVPTSNSNKALPNNIKIYVIY